MSTSNCDELRGLLTWFVGEDLAGAEAERVRGHLIGCMPCRREAASLQQAISALRHSGAAPVAGVDEALFVDLHRGVMAAVAGPAPLPVHRPWWQRLAGRPGVAAVAALLLVGVGFVVGGFWGSGGQFGSVWQRSALPTVDHPGARAAGPSQPVGLPWAMRPLGIESWQRLEDGDAERELTVERLPGLEAGALPAGGAIPGKGLMVRARLRSLVETRSTSAPGGH